MPYRRTTYVDVAYCYRPISIVCRTVCHTSESCKNGWTDRGAVWVEVSGAPREPFIRWGFRSPMGRVNFEGEEGRPIVKYRDTLQWAVQKRLNCLRRCLGCSVGWTHGTICVLDGCPDPPMGRGYFEGEEHARQHSVTWAMQKQLNWSRCDLDYRLLWAKGSMY